MRKLRLIALTLIGAALLSAPGCVELTGQRITWFYDQAKDELKILIHYDGIHDSGSDQHGKGLEQLPEFVANGDVMLLDWFFHLKMADFRKTLQNEDADPLDKDWARLITSIKTAPIGYYREPDGRVGAAQLVTIPKAKDFVRTLNGLISRSILKDEVSPNDPMARTLKRIRAAAKKDHQWVTLDGHAIRVAVPVHADEWARCEAEFLAEVAEHVAKALGEKGDEEEKNGVRYCIRALSCAPGAYINRGHRVEFVVGRPKTPSTLRLQIRDEYEPSLEKAVVDTVKVDLDQALAAAVLDKHTQTPAPLAAVLSFNPPEEPVRALIAAAGGDNDKQKQAAIKQLVSRAKQWNRDHALPEAPKPMDKPDEYLAAWKKWYAHMKQYPVPDEEKQDAEKPADTSQ